MAKKSAAKKATAAAKPVPAKKAAAAPAAKASSTKKAAAKPVAKTGAKRSAPGKKAARTRAASGVMAKAAEVATEMLAGAAVGAITGAANQVRDLPTAVTGTEPVAPPKPSSSARKRAAAKPSAVLGELGPGALAGAVSGAAKAVLPTPKKAAKPPKGKK